MNFLSQDLQPNRWLTVHGPHGVDATAVLKRHSVRLRSQDVIVIAEHDDCEETWLESAWEAEGPQEQAYVVLLVN